MDTNTTILTLIYHHIVLPRRLPQGQDWDHEALSSNILQLLLEAANTMSTLIAADHKERWERVVEALVNHDKIHHHNLIVEEFLEEALMNLKRDNMLILHIMEQNAGVLIIRNQK